MTTHHLKTIQPYFWEVSQENKTFELRKDDRYFKVNDEIYLHEFDPETKIFSGQIVKGIITYVLRNFAGIQADYCILSVSINEWIRVEPSKFLTLSPTQLNKNVYKINNYNNQSKCKN
ncbi:ASCH domain-containing protein [Emticicia fontis]